MLNWSLGLPLVDVTSLLLAIEKLILRSTFRETNSEVASGPSPSALRALMSAMGGKQTSHNDAPYVAPPVDSLIN
jgi:hypothetical protein